MKIQEMYVFLSITVQMGQDQRDTEKLLIHITTVFCGPLQENNDTYTEISTLQCQHKWTW
jgi:hypothetical protein